jgi:hypothetical protein
MNWLVDPIVAPTLTPPGLALAAASTSAQVL